MLPYIVLGVQTGTAITGGLQYFTNNDNKLAEATYLIPFMVLFLTLITLFGTISYYYGFCFFHKRVSSDIRQYKPLNV